jgi:hypothetical protein
MDVFFDKNHVPSEHQPNQKLLASSSQDAQECHLEQCRVNDDFSIKYQETKKHQRNSNAGN